MGVRRGPRQRAERFGWRFEAGLLLGLAPLAAHAQTAAGPQPPRPSGPELVVTAPTPVAGAGIDPDKLPGVVESVTAADFSRSGSLAVTDALAQRIPSVSLSDTQGNGFAKDVDFRGFAASPLQGAPEGLAVYMGAVRLNKSFGDTVNWDLIPEIAVDRADLFTSNPAFGLNALGGAVALRMKTGAGAPGGDASLEAGSFGRVHGAAEQGWSGGPWSLYLGADGGREDGWRLQSPSRLGRLYADAGWSGARTELHLAAAGGEDRLGVVGPTPVDLLAEDRRAVYTYPQTTSNRSGLLALNGRYEAGPAWTLQGDLFVRRFLQSHVDGNDGDFVGCSRQPGKPLYGTLCVVNDDFPNALRPPRAAFQVLGPDGLPIGCPPLQPGHERPCSGVPYGSIDRTHTAATTWGGSVQVSGKGDVLGRGNMFTAGASLERGAIRFSADSTLGVIFPDLSVRTDGPVPGAGEIIHTAGAIAYSPVAVDVSTTDAGLYASDTLDLLARLSLTVSARFDDEHVALSDLTGVSPALDGTHSFRRINPAVGLAWRAGAAVTAYGGYAEASRAPTPLELACSDPLRPCLLENALVADPPLKQVVARTWEAGLRGSPTVAGGRLQWRLAAYSADNDDDIIALASALQGRGSYANVPKTRRRGMEANLDWSAARWSLHVGYGHVDATYRFTGELPSPNSPFVDASGNLHVSAGDHIGGVPADRLKLGGEVEVVGTLTIGADAAYTGPQFLEGDESNQDARLPGYWVADLHATWRVRRGLEIYGRVDNLFDNAFATFGSYFEADALDNLSPSPLPADPDPRSLTPAPPRSFLIGLRASW